jgi:hypothetical protein
MIVFSADGMGHEFLREGWGDLGKDDCWTVGQRAVIEHPVVTRGADHAVKIYIASIYAPEPPRMQRLVLEVNGEVVGKVVCRGAASYEFFLPADVVARRNPMEIRFELPDARRPTDHGGVDDMRWLALNLSRMDLLPLPTRAAPGRGTAEFSLAEQRAALLDLQSLGINCELGFVQRAVGAEPLGLFRWSESPLAQLVPALKQGFAGLGKPDTLDVQMNDVGEFIVEDKLFGFRHHSFLFADKGGTLKQAKRNEFLRVGLLTQSFLEDLREQRKLFVYHDAGESRLKDVRRLLAALTRHGPNTLLWIVGASHDRPVGDVRQLEPGLIQGYVSGFQLPVGLVLPISPHQSSWITVACRAHRLWREARAAAGDTRVAGSAMSVNVVSDLRATTASASSAATMTAATAAASAAASTTEVHTLSP